MMKRHGAQGLVLPGVRAEIRPNRRKLPRMLDGASHLTYQVAVAVIATGLASALFGVGRNAELEPKASGKSTARVAVADIAPSEYFLEPAAVVRAPEKLALPPVVQPEIVKARVVRTPTPKREDAAKPARAFFADAGVLPPRRPIFEAVLPETPGPVASATTETIEKPAIRIAGIAIPSLDIGRYIPDGEPLAKTIEHARSAIDWVKRVGLR